MYCILVKRIVFSSVKPWVKYCKHDLSDFQKVKIMEVCLAGASVKVTIVWCFLNNSLVDCSMTVHKARTVEH